MYRQMMGMLVLSCSWLLLSACGVNPVTGSQEMRLISAQEELSLGVMNYGPMQQQSGGVLRIDPAINRYVSDVGMRIAKVSDRQLPYEFVVLNDSVPNAWALPGGKIAINRGLLVELNTEAELAAVLGHEVVHAAARHSAKKVEQGMLFNIGLITLGALTSDKEYGKAALAAGSVGAVLLGQKYSRDAESEADYYGMQYMVRAGYDPMAAVSLQETFVRLSQNGQPNWLEGLFASHPPSQERVAANRVTAQKLKRAGLSEGREAYTKHFAYLKKIKPAYDKHDEAYKKIKDNDYQGAMQLAEAALAIEPREPSFHALKGDIFYKQKKYQQALPHYDAAIKRDSEYFYPYLRRGESYKALGQNDKAKADLNRSIELMPTKNAQAALQGLR